MLSIFRLFFTKPSRDAVRFQGIGNGWRDEVRRGSLKKERADTSSSGELFDSNYFEPPIRS